VIGKGGMGAKTQKLPGLWLAYIFMPLAARPQTYAPMHSARAQRTSRTVRSPESLWIEVKIFSGRRHDRQSRNNLQQLVTDKSPEAL